MEHMGEVIDESVRFRTEQRLRELKVEHRDLDAAISRLIDDPLHDELLLKRMKKRKLLLKDQIAILARQLDPDISA
jgi:hypothetical protein